VMELLLFPVIFYIAKRFALRAEWRAAAARRVSHSAAQSA